MKGIRKIQLKAKVWIVAFLLLSTFIACMSTPDDSAVASTSISTGNPVGIRILFRKDGGPTSLSCLARLYSITQATIPDFQPNPLATFSLTSAGELRISSPDLERIPDSLWTGGSVEGDSIFKFNIVFDGIETGAWVHGIEYHKRTKSFSIGRTVPKPMPDSLLDLDATFTPFGDVHIGLFDRLDPEQEHYLYIPGTGFFGVNDGSAFRLTLPVGRYAGAVVSRPRYAPVPAAQDSLPVYSLKDSIRFESSNSTSLSDIMVYVAIPASERLMRQAFTQNLTKAQFLFQAGGEPKPFTGSLELYASTQIPVPGFRPEPLASFPIASVDEFALDSTAFTGIPDSLWPARSVFGDSLVKFNVLMAGKDSGSLLTGFLFNRQNKTFARSVNEIVQTNDKTLTSYVDLRHYDTLSIHIDPETLSPASINYFFVYGSPIIGKADTAGNFQLNAPQGTYSLSWLPIEGPNGIGSTQDSAWIYKLRYEATTGIPMENAISSIIGVVALPDSLKH